MHLLAATPGGDADGAEAVDLAQTPGDIIVLSAADTDLAGLAAAVDGNVPSLRLANWMQLGHNYSVDLYVDEIIAGAKLVVVRLLGGVGYWAYGVERIEEVCRRRSIPVAFLPGDAKSDPELSERSTLAPEFRDRLWQYLLHGGPGNYAQFLNLAATLVGKARDWQEPRELVSAGLYWPGQAEPTLEDLKARWKPDQPVTAITFYRALLQAGNLTAVDGLISALAETGQNPLPIHLASLKDPVSSALVSGLLAEAKPDVVLNATGFAISTPGAAFNRGAFEATDAPILQVIFSGQNRDAWAEGQAGLSARDIAMNVALPEVDGRLISRAVSFKAEARFDERTQASLVTYRAEPDRLAFVARLARAWARLRRTPEADRRIAFVLANYPNRDGRLGNGVGLDTPAGLHVVLEAMAKRGYHLEDLPPDGQALIERLAAGPTNDLEGRNDRPGGILFSLKTYRGFFERLPKTVQKAVTERWGDAADDPHVSGDDFRLAAFRLGNITIGLQPSRGYHIDPVSSYHDPALVPPHGYLAFHAWLREEVDIHAICHFGKHGNLEWLPGKGVALSDSCFPEAALGPLPNLYPFIVNDPGEGTQGKRRAQACVIDHLTPPLTRAEAYGELADLEQLVDEYYEAAGVDPRRIAVLREQILDLASSLGLDKDCGFEAGEADETALAKLDNHLCELKELQIRDGLHVFGAAPEGEQRRDLLVSLVRVPRGGDGGVDASILRALAADLGLEGFDPLDTPLGDPWSGPKPKRLSGEAPWRTNGDTVERLEALAARLIAGDEVPDPVWERTRVVLDHVSGELGPRVDGCGAAEVNGLLDGFDGHFVAPGPSGAPTRGRLDTLPTGRNFYSVDSRTVPTPAAWTLGWKSACRLIDRHRQDHGDWPKSLAISAWGTSNMRTGGDDLAQALALIGARPTWDSASRRVTGFEILPLSVLDRPRVDILFRISGFFRDAFPAQVALLDRAIRDVSMLEEPDAQNPLAARRRSEEAILIADGVGEEEARQRAGARVFGSRPGAYGAGLQALIDEKGWESRGDLAEAYITWGGYAYGANGEGQAAEDGLRRALGTVQAVVQNQDNREHDLLDSDDYYQFEGGLTAAVEAASGERPVVYHNDHSRPESPRIRTLEEEIARVVRGRVVNPKWIQGVMRHGYKGAFEMAATVDYLFAFQATANCVGNHHFDAVYSAFLDDADVLDFLETKNPAALSEIAGRLKEAIERGLWRPGSNEAPFKLDHLMAGNKP
ncbi:MAG: cobaltochelatase subunit CobN [Magnetovibrionaceae bacterium]